MNIKEPLQEQDRLGEVVEASSTGFTAHCYRLYEAPPLGALVRCGRDSPIYGVVAEVATQSIDPGRNPVAMGEDEDTVEGVYQTNPQLSRLLSTQFRSLAVGYRADGRIQRYLAPLPPKIHDHVHQCGSEELLEFSDSLDFLPLLLASRVGSPDDVIASFLRQASRSHLEPQAFLVGAGKKLAGLLAGELPRLSGLLRRLSP